MKKIICLFLSLLLLIPYCGESLANTLSTEYDSADLTAIWNENAALSASDSFSKDCVAAVLMERDTKKVLYESNAHEKRAPASITKIMSLLLIVEAIESGRLKLDTVLTGSEYASSMGGSQIWLKVGEEMTVDELLRAAVIASANDATVALAEGVSGSEEGFVKQMNLRAKELGMNDTNFVNCSGLDADGHVSSAYDIAIMSCELLKHKLIKNYTTVWMDSLRGGKSQLVNTNKLVRFYGGTTGLKTGTTSTAGFCVSGSAEKDGMEICAVVLGAKNNDGRFGTAKQLLNYGFANWKLKKVDIDKKYLCDIDVSRGIEKNLKIMQSGCGEYLLNSGEEENITIVPSVKKSVTAPVAKGQKVGTAKVMLNKKLIGEIDIVAAESIKRFTFTDALLLMLHAICVL